jgi:hypothetical protein
MSEHKPPVNNTRESSEYYNTVYTHFVELSEKVASGEEDLEALYLAVATEVCAVKVKSGRKPSPGVLKLPMEIAEDDPEKEKFLKFRDRVNKGLAIHSEMEETTDPKKLCALQLQKLALQKMADEERIL